MLTTNKWELKAKKYGNLENTNQNGHMYYQTLLEDLEQQTTNHKIVKLPKHVTDTHQPGKGLLPENGGDGIWQTHGVFCHDWFYCPLMIFFHQCEDLSSRSGDFVGCKGQADRTELVVLVCGTDKAYWYSSSLSTDRPYLCCLGWASWTRSES